MKHLITAALVILILAFAVQAQAQKPMTIYVGAGLSPLSGDFGDVWNMGFHGMAGLGFNVAPGFQIVPKAEYHRFGLETYGLDIDGGALTSIMLGADGRFQFGLPAAPVRPVILGGVGMAIVSVSDISGYGETIDFDISETELYFEVGGGVSFQTGANMRLFLTARYTSVQTEGESLNYIPLTLSLAF